MGKKSSSSYETEVDPGTQYAEEPTFADPYPAVKDEPQPHVVQGDEPAKDGDKIPADKALEESRIQKVQGIPVTELESKSDGDKFDLIKKWREQHRLFSPTQGSWEELDLILGTGPGSAVVTAQALPHVVTGSKVDVGPAPEGEPSNDKPKDGLVAT